jgi:hypothetical protein
VFVRLVSDTRCGLNAKLQVVVTDSKNFVTWVLV